MVVAGGAWSRSRVCVLCGAWYRSRICAMCSMVGEVLGAVHILHRQGGATPAWAAGLRTHANAICACFVLLSGGATSRWPHAAALALPMKSSFKLWKKSRNGFSSFMGKCPTASWRCYSAQAPCTGWLHHWSFSWCAGHPLQVHILDISFFNYITQMRIMGQRVVRRRSSIVRHQVLDATTRK
jgi:hypothetical protein